jgi:7-cyano-7-deazaguanine reductase
MTIIYTNKKGFVKQGFAIFFQRMLDSYMKYGERAIRKARLDIWPNPNPDRDYEINISFSEFTCLCPRSGYPDFATIIVTYIPADTIVELKTLKLYLNSFRDMAISHEEVTNKVFTDLMKKLKPRYLEVVGDFNPRGNVKTVIRVNSKKK